MICVKIYFNTDAENKWVYTEDTEIEDLPICFFGPFESLDRAISWMENDYPDGDTDVYDMVADEFDIPKEWLNDPATVNGDIPDEDIRPESQEIQGP